MYNTYNQMNNSYKGYCAHKIDLINNMRSVWEQHVWWTRMVILGIVDGLKGVDESVKRLLENPRDMAQVFGKYYPPQIQRVIEQLITAHLTIGAEVIKAASSKNTDAFNDANMRWFKNADDIAKALSGINPYYSESEIKKMLYDHLNMTIKEVQMRIDRNSAADVVVFDSIEKEALKMADYFTYGITKQFSSRF